MTCRLHKLEIKNFKAFRQFTLPLEGRHLLVYGDNGAGKSSLYWALYTFLQSSSKPTLHTAKYFDPNDRQNLLNNHEQDETDPKHGEIALTLRDTATNADLIYRIGQNEGGETIHETSQDPLIVKGDLASDFITYRFIFEFSHFRNSERFDIWPLFEKDILPFCVSTGNLSPLDMWLRIRTGNPNPNANRGQGGTYSYDDFRRNTDAFAAHLHEIVDSISTEAQRFYDAHFAADDVKPITLKLMVTVPPSFSGTNQSNSEFTVPVIEFGIQAGEITITRPQVHLNEAKLTQLALSVRFAASLVNLHESDINLLVLDDLLVSLDMSNRMRVVEILLSATFTNYQKIILTHDLGFFREFRRMIGPSHPDWSLIRLVGDPANKIKAVTEKTELQKAQDYLHGHDLDEAAVCLRKAAEDMARRYGEWSTGTKLPPGEFFTLTQNLRKAKKKLME